ncbi:MAG: inverse autotransporter beta domain-containing protein, partial [Enterobacteriaceae bacterium]
MSTNCSRSLILMISALLGYPISKGTGATERKPTSLPTPGQYQEEKQKNVFSAQANSRWSTSGNPAKSTPNSVTEESGESEQQVATAARQLAGVDMNTLSRQQIANALKERAKAQMLAPVQQQASEFLGQWGRGQVTIAVDDKGRLSNSAMGMLFPLYDQPNHLWFTQAGIRSSDNRRIANWGAGYRFFDSSWMLGGNLFVDQDLSYHHSRLGFGVESASDYARASLNLYTPLTGWRDSKQLAGYLERPAKGFDLRLQGYLPAYPALGSSWVFEQYYGRDVALFGKDHLQNHPQALSLGLDYTPIPLLTLRLNHKQGSQGHQDSQLSLQLNYQFGLPLTAQLNPDQVEALRTIEGSRYDLVDRNYDIVMQYQEKIALSVDLAELPSGLTEGSTLFLSPLVKSKYDITGVQWHGSLANLQLKATAGESNPQGWQITVPSWQSTSDASNQYVISVTLTDTKGHQATSNEVVLSVSPPQEQVTSYVKDNKTSAVAGDQNDSVTIVAKYSPIQQVKNRSNAPVWQVLNQEGRDLLQSGEVKIIDQSENRDNEYSITIISTIAGTFQVVADFAALGKSPPVTVEFTEHSTDLIYLQAFFYRGRGEQATPLQGELQVNSEYSVKIMDTRTTPATDVTARYISTLQWHMAEGEPGNNDQVVAKGTDVFTTQQNNQLAKNRHSRHRSEQGMFLY